MKNAIDTAKFQLIALLSLVSACALTACGNSSSSNATPTVTAQAVPVAPAELQEMRHHAWECPRNIQGEWSTASHGATTTRSYHFEGRSLVEEAPSGQMIYDGTVRTLPPKDGMYFWYVGACKNGSVRLKFIGIGAKTVRIDATTTGRGRRLALAQDINGYQIPFLQIYERTN